MAIDYTLNSALVKLANQLTDLAKAHTLAQQDRNRRSGAAR